MAGMPVETAAEQRNALAPSDYRDLSTTRQSASFPGGARSLTMQYRLQNGATATANQMLRVVFNSASDADATGKLVTKGAYVLLFQGEDLKVYASASDPIYRVDFVTEQAVGTEKTVLQILAGV